LRNRFRNKLKQKPTNQDKVWKRENELAKVHDTKLAEQLASFEAFRSSLIPELAEDVLNGMAPADLREKYASLIQARQIMEAITSEDAGKAGAAAKDILDRSEGKATERKIVEHKFDNLTDQELDAILKSEEEDLEDMKGRFEQ
jgi:hypothetical protein